MKNSANVSDDGGLIKENYDFRKIIILLLQGFVIGAGAIIPGVSGGIMCVAFGLYMPLMQLLANPLKELPKQWKRWLFVGIGSALGVVAFAFGVNTLFEHSEEIAKSAFAGLIFGTLPSLLREAENDPQIKSAEKQPKNKKFKLLSFGIAFALSFSFFAFLAAFDKAKIFSVRPNTFWYVFCGVTIGTGFVIPGMTCSALLMLLGLYKPMLDGALSLDFSVLIPVGIGIAAAIVLFAKLMNYIFKKYYTVAFYAVIGVVTASTLAIVPRAVANVAELILCVVSAVAGFVVSWILDKKLAKFEK